MGRLESGDMIQREVAQRRCAQVRAGHRDQWWWSAAWRSGAGTSRALGDPALLRDAAAPDHRGCSVVTTRHQRAGRPLD